MVLFLWWTYSFKGTTKWGILNQHVETIHGGVHYPCRQWDYEATTNPNLKGHVEAINEIVCYSCSQCYYKATRNDSLKKHVELIHEGGLYLCSLCAYKAINKGHVMSSLFMKAKN